MNTFLHKQRTLKKYSFVQNILKTHNCAELTFGILRQSPTFQSSTLVRVPPPPFFFLIEPLLKTLNFATKDLCDKYSSILSCKYQIITEYRQNCKAPKKILKKNHF